MQFPDMPIRIDSFASCRVRRSMRVTPIADARSLMKTHSTPPRLLIVPGLADSGPAHWQSWLQSQRRDAVRVKQRDWLAPELERWAARIASTLDHAGPGPWVVAAHSFGCLALVHYLQSNPVSPVVGALLVAPAEPDRFGIGGLLPLRSLPIPTTLMFSENDPWLTPASARRCAARWSSQSVNLGAAGHVNAEAGFGPFPLALRWIDAFSAEAEAPRTLAA